MTWAEAQWWLARYSRRHARENERLARTLHDEVGQILSAVGLQMDILGLDVCSRVPEIVERTRAMQTLLDEAMSTVRRLTNQLSPQMSSQGGMGYVLKRIVEAQQRGFDGSILVTGRLPKNDPQAVPPQAAEALCQVVKEALSNAVQHSKCRELILRLGGRGRRIKLEVSDGGCGFDVEQTWNADKLGYGLPLMRYYAQAAGLDLTITSAPLQGTTVRVSYRLPDGRPLLPARDAKGELRWQ
jgi:signal transduction histidine kinase